MKIIFWRSIRGAAITSLLLLHGHSYGAELYGMAGCGAGARVMGPRGGQVSAGTTNHLSFPLYMIGVPTGVPTSQLPSILFGTAGCSEDARPVAQLEQDNFMVTNFVSISKEVAQGEGQTLSGLAQAFGCSQEQYGAFASYLKANYESIFAQPGALAALDETRVLLRRNDTFVGSCKDLGA